MKDVINSPHFCKDCPKGKQISNKIYPCVQLCKIKKVAHDKYILVGLLYNLQYTGYEQYFVS